MTKEQLLDSLKPLEWYFIDCLYTIYADTKLCLYNIAQELSGNFQLTARISTGERIFIASGKTIEELKIFARDHYNNLVLNLFNL